MASDNTDQQKKINAGNITAAGSRLLYRKH